MYTLEQLRRLRWIVGSLVAAGIAASVAMNVFHAPPGGWAVFAAAVPPLLAFGGIHVIAHIPTFGYKVIAFFRNAGAILVTAGAAAISFWQQKGAIRSLSFQEWESWIWPITVDGFMIVVTLSLVAVSRRYRELSVEEESAKATVNRIAEELPIPVSPAPPRPPTRKGGRSGPQIDAEVMSPLTGEVLLDRAPQV
jgi:hypothetical protein